MPTLSAAPRCSTRTCPPFRSWRSWPTPRPRWPPPRQSASASAARPATGAKLVADPQVDVVDITSPNHMHHEMAMAAIAAGKHVYCEKPLSVTVAEAEEMTGGRAQGRRQDDGRLQQRQDAGHHAGPPDHRGGRDRHPRRAFAAGSIRASSTIPTCPVPGAAAARRQARARLAISAPCHLSRAVSDGRDRQHHRAGPDLLPRPSRHRGPRRLRRQGGARRRARGGRERRPDAGSRPLLQRRGRDDRSVAHRRRKGLRHHLGGVRHRGHDPHGRRALQRAEGRPASATRSATAASRRCSPDRRSRSSARSSPSTSPAAGLAIST